MTPKEKAEELVSKMLKEVGYDTNIAVPCALIAVDELINLDYNSLEYYGILSSTDYWIEVKQEIEQIGKKICNYCQKEISKYGCACAFAVESLHKQTSVDFFWKQLAEILPSSVDTETGVKLHRAFEQAKQMEKEQMKEAALDNVTTNEKLRKIFEIQFEDFYNETYGGTK